MIKDEMNAYYKNMIKKEHISSRKVGWRDDLAQNRRFRQLFKLIDGEKDIEIADLGCGLADFYNFLKKHHDNFDYTGYDLSKEMLVLANDNINSSRSKLELINKTEDIKNHDYIILSGVFNMKNNINNQEWLQYVLEQLNIINKKSRKGFAFNMLTSYSDIEHMKDELFYAKPTFFFDFCKKNFSRNIALLHDYNEYDFTIIVRK